MNYWIRIDKEGEMPIESPFLLMDEHQNIYVGFNAFDYYQAEYWYPVPIVPE